MLPIYEAISFNKILQKGGRTEPWLIYVNVEESREPFVVKLFTTDEVDNSDAVAREVFCSVLATEFEMTVPEPALINFSDAFIATLPKNASDILAFRDHRIKFGCKYYPNTTLLSNELPRQHLSKMVHDIGTIYAFDNLILNKDRGLYKTNMLVDLVEDEYFLIDHELALKNVAEVLDEVNGNNFTNVLKKHVLYGYMIRSRSKHELFDTFNQCLSLLNCNILDAYKRQLDDQNIVYPIYEQLKSYICTIKNKGEWFSKILLNNL